MSKLTCSESFSIKCLWQNSLFFLLLVSFPFLKSVLRNMKCQAKLKYYLNESAKMVRFAILV